MAVTVMRKYVANPVEVVSATCEEDAHDFIEMAEGNRDGCIILTTREASAEYASQSVFLSLDNAEAFFKEGLAFVAQLRAG